MRPVYNSEPTKMSNFSDVMQKYVMKSSGFFHDAFHGWGYDIRLDSVGRIAKNCFLQQLWNKDVVNNQPLHTFYQVDDRKELYTYAFVIKE